MSYEVHQGHKKDYKELADTKLPRAKRSTVKQDPDKLYAIEISEEDNRVKIHFTGYSSKHDEWRNREDIVQPSVTVPERYKLLDVHELLAYAIKSSLVSGRDRDPATRLEVPFDRLVFQGGLKLAGKLVRVL